MSGATRSRACRGERVGSTYAFVLITAASVAMLAVTAMLSQRLRTRAARRDTGAREAQVLAASAVEHALHRVAAVRAAADPDDPTAWRAVLEPQTFSGTVGGGSIGWSFQDEDGGSMSTDADDTFYAVGKGKVGAAAHTLRLAVRASGPPYSALEVPLCAKDDVAFASGTIVQADGPIGANGSVTATSSSVFADVWAGDEIAGGTYHGMTSALEPLRGLPDSHSVFDYYTAGGTVISEADLPAVSGDRLIEDVVLSAAVNPYGAANPEGIYIIECDGKDIIIRNARIHATVLLVDPGAQTLISGCVSWSAPAASAPALLVDAGPDGGIAIGLSSSTLVESNRGVNFNPPGTPYEGDEDDTLDDAYPSRIRGLVYIDGPTVFRPSHNRIEGVVICKKGITTEPGTVIELRYSSGPAEDPPPGFFVPDGGLRIGAFSWERPPE